LTPGKNSGADLRPSNPVPSFNVAGLHLHNPWQFGRSDGSRPSGAPGRRDPSGPPGGLLRTGPAGALRKDDTWWRLVPFEPVK
jgi:hypothetical protein